MLSWHHHVCQTSRALEEYPRDTADKLQGMLASSCTVGLHSMQIKDRHHSDDSDVLLKYTQQPSCAQLMIERRIGASAAFSNCNRQCPFIC